MKILITENQLDKVINNYIAKYLDDAERILPPKYVVKKSTLGDYDLYHWKSKNDNRPVFKSMFLYDSEKEIIANIEKWIVREIMDVIGIGEYDAGDRIRNYIEKNILK